MARGIGICFLVLLSSLRVSALDALVSHAVFYLPDPSRSNKLMPSIETYWQINPRLVHYTTTPEKTIVARIKTDIVFSNDVGVVRQDHFILQTVPCKSVNELTIRNITDLRRYFVTPGFIRMKVRFTDLADTLHPFTFSDSFNVAATDDRAFYSDLQLLDTIMASAEQTNYKKNGRQQVPACVNFLDDGRNTLHYYAELYKADKLPKLSYLPIVQRVTIAKNEKELTISDFLKVDTILPAAINIVSGSFNISTLPSGNWRLNVTIENNAHIIVASSSLFFQRLNIHPAKGDSAKIATAAVNDTGMEHINVLNLEKTFVAKYNIPQTHAILKMLLPVSDPLATQTINGFLKKPDDMYIRYFIYNHFLNINKKDPGAAWKEYSDKVKEVNKLFSEHGNPGYETERGFIYLRYGAPTEMVPVENEQGSLPYEVWQYNTLTQMNRKEIANAVFLFYKPNQDMGAMRLLHSSVAGEVQNIAWRSYLYVNGQGGAGSNSRAEQYIGNK